jgi:hypothetical protein
MKRSRHLHSDDHYGIQRINDALNIHGQPTTKLLSDSRMQQLSIAYTSAQCRARASLAISGPGRAYSVARAGRGRTERSSASATAEWPRRDRAPTSEAPAALAIRMKLTMCPFPTPFRVRLGHPSQALGQEPSSTLALSGIRLYGACGALRCGFGRKSLRISTTRHRPVLS